jgi:hypothetical protein
MRRILANCAALAVFGASTALGFFYHFDANMDRSAALADDGTVFTDTPAMPSLKDTLNAGLKSRLPEEFEFVDRVVRLVDHGKLPLDLVQSTFLWARRKPIHQSQYFEHALRMRAEQVGIRL